MRRWLIGLILSSMAQLALADHAHIAVASNFAATAKTLATQFESDTPHSLSLSFGSSGKLYAQIINGAPFSVFLSADQAKPEALEASGRALERRTYARGRLVIWIRQPDSNDWQQQLRRAELGKIAFANPRLAPYGAAAQQVLERLALNDTRNRWITGENIAQTFQFVTSGNAGAGFIAYSQKPAISDEGDLIQLVPAELHAPIDQDVVLLDTSNRNQAARAFYQFLQTPAAQAMIEADGYQVP
jgi:molybdate transport system substrate-binding protein